MRKRLTNNHTYLEKYDALKNEYLTIQEIKIICELSYDKARKIMIELIGIIKKYNNQHPDHKYRHNEKPYLIPKKFFLEYCNIDEKYIFKKAKEELQLNALSNKKELV